ncbi:MAG TPA: Stk1 family PASTA domain-containing Ser/Thr kinase [Acidimicrobiales bacterium]|nr:Stk1 family PASTA domain-containing Ser/Thr kinase [Acidimicrobiales bacterium]
MARQPARVYSGRYEILRQVARGGMAEVYLARDQLLDRPVALKVLFPELSVDRSFVERFRREAQAAANLSHPNVVSVYDWGEEEDTYYIVMEYVDGRPLSSIIRHEGSLLPDRAAAIGAQVAAALGFAHRNGVVHRDVKPGNVLLDGNGHVKVADFGIARAANSQENLTQTGAVMGTATYFSPEQAQGFGVDARSDVYSLGVVLYEMVTGRPPFTGDSPVAIAYKHVREQPVPPSRINPAIPNAFEAIVLQAMAKDPSDRYATAEELRADLLRYMHGGTVVAVPPTMAPPPTEAVATTVVEPDGTQAMPAGAVAPAPVTRRRTGAYVALMFALLAALLALLFLLGQGLGFFGDATGTVRLPNVVGRTADEADRLLSDLGLDVERRFEPSEAEPNLVFAQDPPADTQVERGDTVTIRISQGAERVEVPDVVGEPVDRAKSRLEAAGFTVITSTQPDDDQPAGRVVEQSPDGGQEAAKGSSVRLIVSEGKATAAVPNVIGQDESSARDDIVNAGLRVRTVRETSEQPEGTVVNTNPRPGTELAEGSTVTLVVSSGPPATTTTSTTTTTTSTTSTTMFQFVPSGRGSRPTVPSGPG